MSPEDRAWLAGILEGLAGREVDPRLIDRIISRCEGGRQPYQKAERATPAQVAALPSGPGYGDYDGPGAPPLSEADAVEGALPPVAQPARTIAEMKAQLAAGAPKRKRRVEATENSTPVAEKPPYNPENPTVVRMG